VTTTPTATDPRPFPIPSIRDQVMARLAEMDAGDLSGAIITVNSDLKENVNAAVMVRVNDTFSFAGWLNHNIPHNDNEVGFEIRKVFK